MDSGHQPAYLFQRFIQIDFAARSLDPVGYQNDMTAAFGLIGQQLRRRRHRFENSGTFTREQLRLQYARDLIHVIGPRLQQLCLIGRLQHCDAIAFRQARDEFQCGISGRAGFLRQPAQPIAVAPGVQNQQNVCRNVAHASDLLRLAVFQHQHIINFQGRIVMTVLIRGGDRQAHLFCENPHRLLTFGF